jgi:hypothetical protein
MDSYQYHVDRAFNFSQQAIEELCIIGTLNDLAKFRLPGNVLHLCGDLVQIAGEYLVS